MKQYVGLDVSMEETKIHVLDEEGGRVWRGKCRSEPGTIAATVHKRAPEAVRIGIETGPLTTWLYTELVADGLPMVCLDARHAKKALDMKVNKTDANDADGLAHLVRSGWYREVRVKGREAMRVKALTGARSQLLGMSTLHPGTRHDLSATVNPLTVRKRLDNPLTVRKRLEISVRAKADDVARRLMTVPGIGPLIATAIEALAPPSETFRSGRDFAAWTGLSTAERIWERRAE